MDQNAPREDVLAKAPEPARVALNVLALCFALSVLGRGLGESFTVFLKPISENFGWDRAQVVSVYSLTALAGGLAAPLIGRLFDRSGPRSVYSLGLLLLGGAFLTVLWRFEKRDFFRHPLRFAAFCLALRATLRLTLRHVAAREIALVLVLPACHEGLQDSTRRLVDRREDEIGVKLGALVVEPARGREGGLGHRERLLAVAVQHRRQHRQIWIHRRPHLSGP